MTILHPGDEVKQKIGDPVSYSDAAQKGNANENKPAGSTTPVKGSGSTSASSGK